MVFDRVLNEIKPGTTIPKPQAKSDFKFKGKGRRRGEDAAVYTIPNRSRGRDYEKGVTASELERAFRELTTSGRFTREWFNSQMKECAKEGACNFTTIGGIFELLGEAEYSVRGTYRRRSRSSASSASA